MQRRLEGKRIVITGGSRGFGRAMALTFAREGARLALLARDAEKLASVEKEVQDVTGVPPLLLPIDVSDYPAVRSAFQRIHSEWGRIDGLVNNAATVQPIGIVSDLDPEEWRNTINVDLNGAYFCARESLSSMMDGAGGCIINVTSGLARFVLPRFSVYSTAKGGLNTLTLYLAQELAPYAIRVYGLDPGVMDTDMQTSIRTTDVSRLGEENLEIFEGYKDRGELNPPEKSAALALFLMAEASAEISGQIGGASHFSQYGYVP